MRRTYGNERTHLNLTENGKIKYDYSMFGVFEDHYMSETEVNEFLEGLADDIDE